MIKMAANGGVIDFILNQDGMEKIGIIITSQPNMGMVSTFLYFLVIYSPVSLAVRATSDNIAIFSQFLNNTTKFFVLKKVRLLNL